MSDIQNFRLRQLHGKLGDLVYQYTRVQFAHPPQPGQWAPPLNAYRCPRGFAICVDLAGVRKDEITLHVERRKIRLEGSRETPEPKGKEEQASQILAMEIDSGPFLREVSLPADVEPDKVRAEYKDGFLWIYLPYQCNS
jgi:HSP20 family protein